MPFAALMEALAHGILANRVLICLKKNLATVFTSLATFTNATSTTTDLPLSHISQPVKSKTNHAYYRDNDLPIEALEGVLGFHEILLHFFPAVENGAVTRGAQHILVQ